MNAKQLFDRLADIEKSGEDLSKLEVIIPISGKSIGGSPGSTIIGVNKGFDWDCNRLFIYPNEALKRTSEEK